MEVPSEINQAIFNKLLQIGTITLGDWARIHVELGIEYADKYELRTSTGLSKYVKSTLIKHIRSSEYNLDQNSENFKKLLYPFLLKVNRIGVKFNREGPVPPVSESQTPVQQALIRYKLDKMDNKAQFNSDVYNILCNIRGKSFEIHVDNPEFNLNPRKKSKLCGPSKGQKPRVVATGWANKAGPIDDPPMATIEEEQPEASVSPTANVFVQGEEVPTTSRAGEEEAPTKFSIDGRIFEFDQLNAYLEELIPKFVENGAENIDSLIDNFVKWSETKEKEESFEESTPDILVEDSGIETSLIAGQTDCAGTKETKDAYVSYLMQELANMPADLHALYCKTDRPISEELNLPLTYPEWLKKNHL